MKTINKYVRALVMLVFFGIVIYGIVERINKSRNEFRQEQQRHSELIRSALEDSSIKLVVRGMSGKNKAGHDQIAGLWIETRHVLLPQFHNNNNVINSSGQMENTEKFVPGPSPDADEIATRTGVDAVHSGKHLMTVDYRDGYLAEENLHAEADYIASVLQKSLGGTVEIIWGENLTYDPEECKIWEPPFGCRLNTLYVPKDRPINTVAIEALPGIESVDELEDGGFPGYRRVNKSDLYTWAELKSVLGPLLATN